MTDAPAIDLEGYARMLARLRGATGARAAPVLAEAGLTPQTWRTAADSWRELLARDRAEGRGDRVMTFAAAYRDERSKTRAVRQSVASADATERASAAIARPTSVDDTSDLLSTLGPPLPFHATQAQSEAAASLPPSTRHAEPHPDVGMTGELEISVLDTTMPFLLRGPASQNHPEPAGLDRKRYASLCAELAIAREPEAIVLRRYGVQDEATRGALTSYWDRRFERDPQERADHQRLMAEYRAWLQARGSHR
jgi:hypothetical protein